MSLTGNEWREVKKNWTRMITDKEKEERRSTRGRKKRRRSRERR